MKPSKAPEKIYIHPDIGGREFLRPWLRRAANNESVEYTRTDAFIEKACNWIEKQGEMVGISFTEDFIARFQNYMKEDKV